jgi:hypothetical protein
MRSFAQSKPVDKALVRSKRAPRATETSPCRTCGDAAVVSTYCLRDYVTHATYYRRLLPRLNPHRRRDSDPAWRLRRAFVDRILEHPGSSRRASGLEETLGFVRALEMLGFQWNEDQILWLVQFIRRLESLSSVRR